MKRGKKHTKRFLRSKRYLAEIRIRDFVDQLMGEWRAQNGQFLLNLPYWQALPGSGLYLGLDRSSGPDRTFEHIRYIDDDGNVREVQTREISLGATLPVK